jgi:hypothetical protein
VDISNIHFHDTGLLRVLEDTTEDTLTFEVDYPTNWAANVFERRWIVFYDVLDYRVCEGPFHGSPTILDVQITTGAVAGRCQLQIDTNAGTRYLSCTEVRLLEQQPGAANKALQATAAPPRS